ncbi:MAG: hypothetical protein Q9M19_07285 [Mariprofundaceae bacterium]|nr:hypothetical protein [Mariprofundaceae bacterium]
MHNQYMHFAGISFIIGGCFSGKRYLKVQQLHRRGFDLGQVATVTKPTMPQLPTITQSWNHDQAVLLPQLLSPHLPTHQQHIQQAQQLMENVLNSAEVTPYFEQEPYSTPFSKHFSIVASSMEEHDEQGIEKMYIDAHDEGKTVAEELWCKASWLSFYDEDASLRFRFSWGMEGYEDVSSNPDKQAWAGKLCDVLFPESALICQNSTLLQHLQHLLGHEPAFVERIVYFNAPQGGAQFHHDVERGHAGVVFAQLSGSTFWLALAKPKLMDEIIAFVHNTTQQQHIQSLLPSKQQQQALLKLCQNREDLSAYMEEVDHELIEAIIDRCPAFIAQLVQQGYTYQLNTGDVLLLPQRDIEHCVWHSVFHLGEHPGEALSFAIR